MGWQANGVATRLPLKVVAIRHYPAPEEGLDHASPRLLREPVSEKKPLLAETGFPRMRLSGNPVNRGKRSP
jgi:hypothetical protein